jgi:hypothetical protein
MVGVTTGVAGEAGVDVDVEAAFDIADGVTGGGVGGVAADVGAPSDPS